MIDDERWAFVFPLLPIQRRHTEPGPRGVFAAVVHAITTDTAWQHLPDVFGVSPSAARRQFWRLTDADLWRTLTAAAAGTPHTRWTCAVADAAIYRARYRPVHGYQPIDDEPPAGPADPEPGAPEVMTGERTRATPLPALQRLRLRPSPQRTRPARRQLVIATPGERTYSSGNNPEGERIVG